MNILNIENLNYHSAPDPPTSGHNLIVTFFYLHFSSDKFFNSGEKSFCSDKLYYFKSKELKSG